MRLEHEYYPPVTFDLRYKFEPGFLTMGDVFPFIDDDIPSLERARIIQSASERLGKVLSHINIDFGADAAQRGVQPYSPVQWINGSLQFGGPFKSSAIISKNPIAYIHQDGGVEHLTGVLGSATNTPKYSCELFVPQHGIIRYSHPIENQEFLEMIRGGDNSVSFHKVGVTF